MSSAFVWKLNKNMSGIRQWCFIGMHLPREVGSIDFAHGEWVSFRGVVCHPASDDYHKTMTDAKARVEDHYIASCLEKIDV